MNKIIEQAKKISTKQDYSPKRLVEGVEIIEIKRFVGEDGAFNEVVRLKEGKVILPKELKGFEVRQVNYSRVVPQTIKAWHYHQKQDEIWFVHPESKVIVGLLDLREKSSTCRFYTKIALGDGKAHLLYIPRGVAHGLSNPYPWEATMTYLVNNWFDGTDEWRLPYDFIVGRKFWEVEKG